MGCCVISCKNWDIASKLSFRRHLEKKWGKDLAPPAITMTAFDDDVADDSGSPELLLPATENLNLRNRMPLNRTIDSYQFGFSLNLTDSQLSTLTVHFHQSDPNGVSVLGGRTAATPARLKGIGPVVIKHYRRGGLVRHFIKQRYLKLGKTRAQREFELLDLVARLGTSVPQPIAYAHRGRLFYRAWLVTRAIDQPISLASLSLQDEKKTITVMKSVIEQIASLIQNDILHIDLHPGNVAVDTAGKVYLLDFDKGSIYYGSRQKLKNRYLTRWQRAVSKHRLPEMLSERLQDGLN